jgi:hypothetical protein
LRFGFHSSGPTRSPLRIWLESGDARRPVEVDSKGEFSLPAVPSDMLARATIVANRETGSGMFRPLVRTAGLDGEDRRLGDLRLECQVLWAIEKDNIPLLFRLSFGATGGPCNSSKVEFSFPAAKGLLHAVVVDEAQRADVKILQSGRSYWPPMHDQSLRDSAIVKFTFTDA